MSCTRKKNKRHSYPRVVHDRVSLFQNDGDDLRRDHVEQLSIEDDAKLNGKKKTTSHAEVHSRGILPVNGRVFRMNVFKKKNDGREEIILSM